MKKISKVLKGTLTTILFFFLILPRLTLATPVPLIIDHTVIGEFEKIPVEWITKAKEMFKIAYGHTSHGGQIVTGMNMLTKEFGAKFSYTTGSFAGNDFLADRYPSGDLGNPDRTSWATRTRDMLKTSANKRNMVIWSWCGQVSDATEVEINTYLNLMNGLEKEFPKVTFVYMTGHLDGTKPTGNLYLRNNQIREYCRANNKILFDFADIESYDPAGKYYPNDSDACKWCATWCSEHSSSGCSCASGNCAHSHCFNCYNKGKAFWYMMARLAGWDGGVISSEPVTVLEPVIISKPSEPAVNLEDLSTGDLVKVIDSSSVYLIDKGKRRPFFNSKYFLSNGFKWQDVKIISNSTLSQFSIGEIVNYPAGTLIKIQTVPKVYIIDENGLLRWIKTESVFNQLFGDNWHNIIDVDVTLFSTYGYGNNIEVQEDINQIKQKPYYQNLDLDRDGLFKYQELIFGTNPEINDTDGDGFLDGEEVKSGHDPLKG